MSKRLILPAMALISALFPEAASAHPAQYTTLQVTINPGGGFLAALNIDILAYALGETSLESTNEELQALLDGPRAVLGQDLARAGDSFRREVVLSTDAGVVIPSSWTLPGLPEVDAVLARKIQPRILMPGEIEFTGTLPAGAHTLTVRLPYVLGETMQVFELPDGNTDAAPVAAGEYSRQVKLDLQPPGAQPAGAASPGGGFTRNFDSAVASLLLVIGLFMIGARLLPIFRKAWFRPTR